MALPLVEIVNVRGRDVSVYRASNDANGNPRYVVHYLAVPFRDRAEGEDYFTYQAENLEFARLALWGKRYRGKDFGGGIVFSSYNYREQISLAIAGANWSWETASQEW